MRNCILKALFGIFLIFGEYCLADSNCAQGEIHFIPCQKTYVQSHQVAFSENAIFIQINDVVIQTDSIHSDPQGIFFEKVKDDGCGSMQWKCTKQINRGVPCNTCNLDFVHFWARVL